MHLHFRRVRGRRAGRAAASLKKIIDLADVVLGVYDVDISAAASAEDRALAYVKGQHKPLLLLHPTELTVVQMDFRKTL